MNDAIEDVKSSGWLIDLEDDESLTFAANTYEYAVPASFAYVSELRVENTATTPSTWDEDIPFHFWTIRLDSSVPTFFFHRAWPIPVDKKMKVIGQRRPTLHSSGATGLAETVEPGFESFIRERAAAYALSFQAVGFPGPVVDQGRIALMDRKMAHSEKLIALHPQEFRVSPSSEHVPGR